MATIVKNLIKGIGITEINDLPQNPLYFTEICIPETLIIPEPKPDVEQLLSIIVDPQILSLRIIDTPVATTPDGQNLSGAKLIIELKLREKILYVADEPTQSVHAAHFENILQSVFIIVPTMVGNVSIKKLLEQGKIIVTPYIEDIWGQLRDKRTVFKNITVLIDVTFLN